MAQSDTKSKFKAKLLRPLTSKSDAAWAFVILPKDASAKLPRRGRTTVEGSINGLPFHETLEPDSQLSHWLQIKQPLREAAGADIGSTAAFEIMSVKKEPEPKIPADFKKALTA